MWSKGGLLQHSLYHLLADKLRKYILFVSSVCFLILATQIFTQVCNKNKSWHETKITVIPDFDVNKIENMTGVQFRIGRIITLGYQIRHKFYWIFLSQSISTKSVEDLAEAVIEEVISKAPKHFSTFTIHFFLEDEFLEKGEKPRYFARVHFLPEGTWQKAGRIPIDEYENYKWIVFLIEEKP